MCLLCDGFSGFPEALETVFPHTQVQLICIVQWCATASSLSPGKKRKAVATYLKAIYQAATVAEAELALDTFCQTWDAQYPGRGSGNSRNGTSGKKLKTDDQKNLAAAVGATHAAYPNDIRKVIYLNGMLFIAKMIRHLRVQHPFIQPFGQLFFLSRPF
jgi:transposase-like protein